MSPSKFYPWSNIQITKIELAINYTLSSCLTIGVKRSHIIIFGDNNEQRVFTGLYSCVDKDEWDFSNHDNVDDIIKTLLNTKYPPSKAIINMIDLCNDHVGCDVDLELKIDDKE